jgi:acetyl/propionyl-CoA carboxylase alpha subunit
LYAEDPAQGFIPTPGRIEKLIWPTGAGIRIESGIEEGQTVGIQFDSMLGKLIVYGQTREHAVQRLRFALEDTVILGVGTNQNFLRSLIEHPLVKEGKVNTGFLDSEFSTFSPVPTQQDLEFLSFVRSSGVGRSQMTASGSSSSSNITPSPWSAFQGVENRI